MIGGYTADGRYFAEMTRQHADEFKSTYGESITPKVWIGVRINNLGFIGQYGRLRPSIHLPWLPPSSGRQRHDCWIRPQKEDLRIVHHHHIRSLHCMKSAVLLMVSRSTLRTPSERVVSPARPPSTSRTSHNVLVRRCYNGSLTCMISSSLTTM